MGLVNDKPYLDKGRMEPLTFAILKGLTPEEHEVAFYDDRFEAIPYDEPTDLVAINTEIYTAKRTYEICAEYKNRNVPVVLGGYHTTLLPEEGLEYADSVVVGDAEPVWETILKDAQKNRLKKIYRAQFPENKILRHIKTDWSIFENKSYLPVRLTQFGRGCPNYCEYCATGAMYKRNFYRRDVQSTIAELEQDGSKMVFFVDDNIVSDKEAAKELFRALIPLKINWFSQADITFAEDPVLMDLMLESGCMGLLVGFESLDMNNLKKMNKNCNFHLDSYDPLIEKTRQAGFLLWAAFLLGYDYETVQSVQDTVDWALSKKFTFSAFNILMPYPGTSLYKKAKAENRLLYGDKWWLHDDYRFGSASVIPKNCEPEELAEACYQARMKHSSLGSIASRAMDPQTHMKSIKNLAAYFMYNPIFRDEMKKKHGMKLGYRGLERIPKKPKLEYPGQQRELAIH